MRRLYLRLSCRDPSFAEHPQGKRAPSKDVFANYCQITNHRSEEYWDTNDSKPMAFLMGKISETDEKNLLDVLEKIGMREYLFALYNRVSK